MSKDLIKFTGEYFVPGISGKRIESDHIERYRFACNYVKNRSVLDIACGYGYSAPLIIDAGATMYVGVDINEQLVNNASSLYGSDLIRYYQGDICSYKSNELYDVIICFETIEHVREYRRALLNIHNQLAVNGVLLISSPNRLITSPNAKCISDKPSNPYHVQEFTIAELKNELISLGFSIHMNIWGQRISKNIFLDKCFKFLIGGSGESILLSAKVAKIHFKEPRYFILVASKY